MGTKQTALRRFSLFMALSLGPSLYFQWQVLCLLSIGWDFRQQQAYGAALLASLLLFSLSRWVDLCQPNLVYVIIASFRPEEEIT